MGFWQQQLNFALWCATTGCGVSREKMLFPNSGLNLREQLRTFYQFHVYYTTRKILYEMGGIQSKNALPDDEGFNEINNPYNVAAYNRICAEFGISPSTDFRYTRGRNGGLGTVYIWVAYSGPEPTHYHYPDPDLALFNNERKHVKDKKTQKMRVIQLGDEGYKANGIYFIRNDQGAENQLEHFVPDFSSGLTQRGLGRINRSIEAFGYCILGAQANTRSSIIGTTGTAINTQTDFLVLVDDAIRTLIVSSELIKYQTAIEMTKVRLNFAVARGVLLLPSRMIINTESVVGYNNNLRRTTDDMKLGVNNQVNLPTKKAALKLMAGGPSKVNPPNSHPSNPIHKQAVQAQGLAPAKVSHAPTGKPTVEPPEAPTGQVAASTPPPQATTDTPPVAPPAQTASVEAHHVNKALVAVGVLASAGFVAWMR